MLSCCVIRMFSMNVTPLRVAFMDFASLCGGAFPGSGAERSRRYVEEDCCLSSGQRPFFRLSTDPAKTRTACFLPQDGIGSCWGLFGTAVSFARSASQRTAASPVMPVPFILPFPGTGSPRLSVRRKVRRRKGIFRSAPVPATLEFL